MQTKSKKASHNKLTKPIKITNEESLELNQNKNLKQPIYRKVN